MPPKRKSQSAELPEVIEQGLERLAWIEALFMALGATADSSRLNLDLPHIVSNLADLGAHLAQDASTLLLSFNQRGANHASKE